MSLTDARLICSTLILTDLDSNENGSAKFAVGTVYLDAGLTYQIINLSLDSDGGYKRASAGRRCDKRLLRDHFIAHARRYDQFGRTVLRLGRLRCDIGHERPNSAQDQPSVSISRQLEV